MGYALLLALLLLAPLGSGCASLGPDQRLPAPDPKLARCDADTASRLQFLESRLESHARYARRWWWAWNGVFGAGIVYGGAVAALEDGRGERADQAVNVVQSAIGLGENLLAPPVVRAGAGALRAIDTGRSGGCAERLAAAEDLLRAAARDAHRQRRGWASHLGNLALNLIGAVVVAEGFHEGSGWGSGAVGIVVGEIRIWTYPWQAERTLEEYEGRFPRTASGKPRWRSERQGERWLLVLE